MYAICTNKNILILVVFLFLTGCAADTDTDQTIQDQLKNGVMAPELVAIPTGTNILGDISGSGLPRESPTYKVTISSSFAIGKYEVTFDEYDYFCELTGRIKPNDEGWGRGKRPVIDVTWYDAQDYVQWLTKSTGKEYYLPSESQWEYAARAGTKTNYWWGDTPGDKLAQCVNCAAIIRCENCKDVPLVDDGTAKVGSFEPNPFGLYDVHGNVMEWTADCGNKYNSKTPGDGSPRLAGNCDRHIMKDGSWWNNVRFIRASVRGSAVDGRDYKSQHVGFRVARRIR